MPMQPLPEQISRISIFFSPELTADFIKSIARITRISVSGFGIKTSSVTKKSYPKNSFEFVMYETGSPVLRFFTAAKSFSSASPGISKSWFIRMKVLSFFKKCERKT